ncbi:MAG: class I SAM-dependent methyltransferase [Candidatus Methanoperedens sp.]
MKKVQMTKVPKDEVCKYIPNIYMTRGGLSGYYHKLFIFKLIFWRRLDCCLQLLNEVDFKSKLIIADIGCGFGIFIVSLSKLFSNSEIVGLDFRPQELKYAKELQIGLKIENSNFIGGDAQNLPLANFDIIFALDVLEHIPDPIKALHQINNSLKTDGIFIVSVPIESFILRALRFLYFKGQKVASADPHWHGTIKDFKEFEKYLAQSFEIMNKKYVPFYVLGSLINYDVVYLCKKKK